MMAIRVLVVDDSLTVRKELINSIEADPMFRIVGEARDGREAVTLCEELRPDVVTMDMALPGLSGLDATIEIMAHFPTPILIVSGSMNRGDVLRTCDALSAGAVDALEKPGRDADLVAWRADLRARLRVVSRVRVIRHIQRRHRAHQEPAPAAPRPRGARPAVELVALGASTGGPTTIRTLLGDLPPSFPLPILLVIHLDHGFAAGFLEWLDRELPIPVAFAEDHQPLPPRGTPGVLLAPPDRHLRLEGTQLRLDDSLHRYSCRPSVDVLFESLATSHGPRAMAALLTGMGRDGAAGLLALTRAGGLTVAQDEATSVVYGMPAEAARLNAASAVLPIGSIRELIVELGRPSTRMDSP